MFGNLPVHTLAAFRHVCSVRLGQVTHLYSQGCDFSGSRPPVKVEHERKTVAVEPNRMKQSVINPFCATPENHYPVNKVCVSLLRVATDGQVGLSRAISLQSAMCVGIAAL